MNRKGDSVEIIILAQNSNEPTKCAYPYSEGLWSIGVIRDRRKSFYAAQTLLRKSATQGVPTTSLALPLKTFQMPPVFKL